MGTLFKKTITWIKKILGNVVFDIIVTLIVALLSVWIITIKTYDIAGRWDISIDYDTFFGKDISYYGQSRILAEGEVYIIKTDNKRYKGLAYLDIFITPEKLEERKRFIFLVLEFSDFEKNSEKNKYKGSVKIKHRYVDELIIAKHILTVINERDLTIPTEYTFTLNIESPVSGKGTFRGQLKDGKITTRGLLGIKK